MFSIVSEISIHFIGIGGIGMSGIAEILLKLGHKVSGSDLHSSTTTDNLIKLGAKIYIGHHQDNVKDATVIVYSSAIDESNPEIIMARISKIPLMRRAEMLADLMRLKKGVAIAGTHGKTTTTSILATILKESDYDPTYVIGGVVKNLGGHAKIGSGDFLVAEADESDGSFLLLNPIISLITNIDFDHMEFYKTKDNYEDSFVKFSNKIPFFGFCSLNIEDHAVREIVKNLKRPYVTYGVIDGDSIGADYEARNVEFKGFNTNFDLFFKDVFSAKINLALPGRHNVSNALGAISIAHGLGVSFDKMAVAVNEFTGISRRFQKLYERDDCIIIDDYGHHPTEVSSTIKALKTTFPDRRKLVVFEPHRYSRTRDCWDQFLHSFNNADEVVMAPIYPASERPIAGINSERMVSDINRLHPSLSTYIKSLDELEGLIKKLSKDKVAILTLGAGSIGRKIREIVSGL